MEVPDETRIVRRTDLVRQPRRNGPSMADLPQPIPPEPPHEYWVDWGFGALRNAFIFGCMITGIIFLAFAIYNALCDPFQYFNILLTAAAVYLIFLVVTSIWSYCFGNERFSDADSQSNAQSNNNTNARRTRSNNTSARNAQPNNTRRDLIISERESNIVAKDNFVRESITADRITEGLQRGRNVSRTGQSDFAQENQPADRNAQGFQGGRSFSQTRQSENSDQENLTADRNAQGFQAGRSLSGPGESYRYETDDVRNNRRTSGVEASAIYPPSQRRTSQANPRVNEFQDRSAENWDMEHDMGQNRQPENTGIDNTWFSSTQQRTTRPYISSDFPACVALSLKMNAPRPVANMAATAAGTSILHPTCRRPLTPAQQQTPTRTCLRPATPTNCVQIGNTNCISLPRTSQQCPQTCPSGTGRNLNLQQGQNYNYEGNQRIFHQPGPCALNLNRPVENAFFSPGTDGYD